MLYIKSFLLGLALSADAFSVAVKDGLVMPNTQKKRLLFIIPVVYGVLQGAMPLLGYFFISFYSNRFALVSKFSSMMAIITLFMMSLFMFFKKDKQEKNPKQISFLTIIIQGIATSIDALVAGLALATFTISEALICGLIIVIVTIIMCFFAVVLGGFLRKNIKLNTSLLAGGILLLLSMQMLIKQFF